jgi:class 3 adenylate cyclase
VAARVAAVASADEILVSAALAERLATQDDVRPCGTKVLKGLAEPVEIARVDWV